MCFAFVGSPTARLKHRSRPARATNLDEIGEEGRSVHKSSYKVGSNQCGGSGCWATRWHNGVVE